MRKLQGEFGKNPNLDAVTECETGVAGLREEGSSKVTQRRESKVSNGDNNDCTAGV